MTVAMVTHSNGAPLKSPIAQVPQSEVWVRYRNAKPQRLKLSLKPRVYNPDPGPRPCGPVSWCLLGPVNHGVLSVEHTDTFEPRSPPTVPRRIHRKTNQTLAVWGIRTFKRRQLSSRGASSLNQMSRPSIRQPPRLFFHNPQMPT